MILIADSGSTKTDWVLWNKESDQSTNHQSKGLNPFFVDADEIAETIKSTFTDSELHQIKQVYFYGAGCSSEESKATVETGFKKVCPVAKTEVNHDLLAAARAVCGHQAGIACILGTGSNSCVYDGKNIIEEGVSFGFIMGDEGSGSHLGKLLLKSIYTKKAPNHIIQAFEQSYAQINLSKLLAHLYHHPSPNKFLASFSPFIRAHYKDEFIKSLIINSFDEFLDYFVFDFVKKYHYPVHFQGSIAWNYKEELSNRLKKHEIKYEKIIHHPLQSLFEYHKNN